jgi:transcriptional regulator with XRE-family HTH domain
MSGPIGADLRAAREARDLTLEEVEDRLKIRLRYLRAIEGDRWDMLPSGPYAHAWVRSYAELLGLDGAEFVERYREQQRDEAEGPVDVEARERVDLAFDPRAARAPQSDGRRRWIRIAAGVAAIAVVGIVVVAVVGEGGSGPAPDSSRSRSVESVAHARDRGTKPSPPPAPSRGRVRLTATGTVWACMVDGGGKVLLDGVTLSRGEKAGPFRAKRLEMNFGNGLLALIANGERVPIASEANPVGFVVSASGVRDLREGQRPTCG